MLDEGPIAFDSRINQISNFLNKSLSTKSAQIIVSFLETYKKVLLIDKSMQNEISYSTLAKLLDTELRALSHLAEASQKFGNLNSLVSQISNISVLHWTNWFCSFRFHCFLSMKNWDIWSITFQKANQMIFIDSILWLKSWRVCWWPSLTKVEKCKVFWSTTYTFSI